MELIDGNYVGPLDDLEPILPELGHDTLSVRFRWQIAFGSTVTGETAASWIGSEYFLHGPNLTLTIKASFPLFRC